MGIPIRKAQKPSFVMALSKSEAKKSAGDVASEEEIKCMMAEAAGEGEKLDEGVSAGNVV